MPSAVQMGVGQQEINLSLVRVSDPGAGDLTLYEAYYGLSDSLEFSLTKLRHSGEESSQSFNVSYLVTPETPDNWATVLGASNVGGDQYLGSDHPSYYVACYRTRTQTGSRQKGSTPGYRYHVGYGTNVHDGFFGGVQVITGPRMWMGAFNYGGQPTYIADYSIVAGRLYRLSLRAGYLHGDPWVGLSYGSAGG